MYFAFDDIRDAQAAFQEINLINTKVDVAYVNHGEYALSNTHGQGSPTSFFDGQIVYHAHFEGLTSEMDAQHLSKEVCELAQSRGELLAFADIECSGGNRQFRVEYYKISVAKHVIETLTRASPKQLGVSLKTT